VLRRYLENIKTGKKTLWTAMHGRTFEGKCNEDQCNSELLGENPAAMILA